MDHRLWVGKAGLVWVVVCVGLFARYLCACWVLWDCPTGRTAAADTKGDGESDGSWVRGF